MSGDETARERVKEAVEAAEREESSRLSERYGLLLIALVAVFAIEGIATPTRLGQLGVTILLAGTLLLSFRAGDLQPRLMRPAFGVAAIVVIAALVDAATSDVAGASAALANMLLVVLAPPAIVVGVVRSLRAHRQVTAPAVLGVLCVYLLLGMFFAFLYGAIGHLAGGFFAEGQKATAAHTLYFSFTTLTTVGYGDFTAASNLGHTLSVTEALVGQIYLVTVVSLIVGNVALGGHRRR